MKLMIEAPDDVVEYARRIAKCREKKEVNDDTKYREDVREASLWGQMIGIRKMNINTHILYRSMICIGNGIEVKEDDTITIDKIKNLIKDVNNMSFIKEVGSCIAHKLPIEIKKEVKKYIYERTGVKLDEECAHLDIPLQKPNELNRNDRVYTKEAIENAIYDSYDKYVDRVTHFGKITGE